MRLRHERSLVLAPLALAACSSAAPAVGRTEPVAEQIHVAAFEAPHALDSAIAAVAPASADGEGSGAEVVSTASRASGETERVGAYGQPEWTTRRRFARTRVYVLPEGQLEFEQAAVGAGLGQQSLHRLDEVGGLELQRRQVHRHRHPVHAGCAPGLPSAW